MNVNIMFIRKRIKIFVLLAQQAELFLTSSLIIRLSRKLVFGHHYPCAHVLHKTENKNKTVCKVLLLVLVFLTNVVCFKVKLKVMICGNMMWNLQTFR